VHYEHQMNNVDSGEHLVYYIYFLQNMNVYIINQICLAKFLFLQYV